MGVYLYVKFEASSIIVTSFRQRVILPPPLPNSKRNPKKPTQIRVKFLIICERKKYFNLKTFLSLNISDFSFFSIYKLQLPLKNINPLFPSKPSLWKFDRRLNSTPSREGSAHYMSEKCIVYRLLKHQKWLKTD